MDSSVSSGRGEEPAPNARHIDRCNPAVAVVGSRPPKKDASKEAWDRWAELERACIAFVNSLPAGTLVVSGAVPWIEKGIDQTAERVARARGLPVQSWRPIGRGRAYSVWVEEWTAEGVKKRVWIASTEVFPSFAAAAFWRNGEMVRVSGKVAAFWDGQSRGTADTMRKARAAGKLLP